MCTLQLSVYLIWAAHRHASKTTCHGHHILLGGVDSSINMPPMANTVAWHSVNSYATAGNLQRHSCASESLYGCLLRTEKHSGKAVVAKDICFADDGAHCSQSAPEESQCEFHSCENTPSNTLCPEASCGVFTGSNDDDCNEDCGNVNSEPLQKINAMLQSLVPRFGAVDLETPIEDENVVQIMTVEELRLLEEDEAQEQQQEKYEMQNRFLQFHYRQKARAAAARGAVSRPQLPRRPQRRTKEVPNEIH